MWVEAQARLSAQEQKDTGVPNTHVLDVHMEPPTDTNNIRARLMLKIPPNFSTKKKNDFKPGLRGRVCPGCFLQDRAHGWLHSQNGQLDDQEQFFFWKAHIVDDCNQEIQSLPIDCLPLVNHK